MFKKYSGFVKNIDVVQRHSYIKHILRKLTKTDKLLLEKKKINTISNFLRFNQMTCVL